MPQTVPKYNMYVTENSAEYGGAICVADETNIGTFASSATDSNECFLQVLVLYEFEDRGG